MIIVAASETDQDEFGVPPDTPMALCCDCAWRCPVTDLVDGAYMPEHEDQFHPWDDSEYRMVGYDTPSYCRGSERPARHWWPSAEPRPEQPWRPPPEGPLPEEETGWKRAVDAILQPCKTDPHTRADGPLRSCGVCWMAEQERATARTAERLESPR